MQRKSILDKLITGYADMLCFPHVLLERLSSHCVYQLTTALWKASAFMGVDLPGAAWKVTNHSRNYTGYYILLC